MPKPIARALNGIKGSKWTVTAGGAIFTATISSSGIPALGTLFGVIAGTTAATELTAGVLVALGFLSVSAAAITFPILGAVFLVKNRKRIFQKKDLLDTNEVKSPVEWDCFFQTAAILGIGRTGKTLLKKKLLGLKIDDDIVTGKATTSQTKLLEIQMTELDSDEKVYLAIIDNAGATKTTGKASQREIQKFFGIVQTIIVVLDHAQTDPHIVGKENTNNPLADDDRLDYQKELIGTIDWLIDEELKGKTSSLRQVILIMNKVDCWGNKKHDRKIRKWFEEVFELINSKYNARIDVFRYYMSIMKDDNDTPRYKEFRERLVDSAKQYVKVKE